MDQADPDFPEQVAAALARGRRAYAEGKFEEAEAADLEARDLAVQARCEHGEARALRFIGLCRYRRGHLAESEAALRAAMAKASSLQWLREELLAHNHLGATLRKAGRLDDADEIFRGALERADPATQLDARARLLGNYGAFLDDLGEEQAAGEYYARYEELTGLLKDPGRLANARGLVSRSARRRGDHRTALVKALDEVRLGEFARNPGRAGRGWLHVAQANAAIGDVVGAEQAFAEAEAIVVGQDVRTPIELAVARGRFLLAQHRIHEAHEQVERARRALSSLSAGEDEHRARVHELGADVASEAGLHGEALWYLGEAMEAHLRRFEPIKNLRLRDSTGKRRTQLIEFAGRLRREAGIVERDAEELERVDALVKRLGADAPAAPAPLHEPIAVWHRRVRDRAVERWERLIPGFELLDDTTRGDLVLADVVSLGPVGDLSRSLLLLMSTIERELRDRVLDRLESPPRSAGGRRSRLATLIGRENYRPALGDIVEALVEPPFGFPATDPRMVVARAMPTADFSSLGALTSEVADVQGVCIGKPIEQRNQIAHGHRHRLPRIGADAIRRVLTLGPRPVLATVAGLAQLDPTR